MSSKESPVKKFGLPVFLLGILLFLITLPLWIVDYLLTVIRQRRKE